MQHQNFAKAAALRDELRLLLDDAEVAVLVANDSFYSALRAHDVSRMNTLWEDGTLAGACIRSFDGFPPLHGRQTVLDTWLEVFGPQLAISLESVRCAVLRGGLSAVVTCVERRLGESRGDGALSATNVFEKNVDGQWRLVLHQAVPFDDPTNAQAESAEHEVEYDADDFPGATG